MSVMSAAWSDCPTPRFVMHTDVNEMGVIFAVSWMRRRFHHFGDVARAKDRHHDEGLHNLGPIVSKMSNLGFPALPISTSDPISA